jgi:hypothetical protein
LSDNCNVWILLGFQNFPTDYLPALPSTAPSSSSLSSGGPCPSRARTTRIKDSLRAFGIHGSCILTAGGAVLRVFTFRIVSCQQGSLKKHFLAFLFFSSLAEPTAITMQLHRISIYTTRCQPQCQDTGTHVDETVGSP